MILDMLSIQDRTKERLELLDRACQEIEKSGLGALANHVLNVRRALRRHMPATFHVPYGLAVPQDTVSDRYGQSPLIAEGKQMTMLTQPQCVARFTHLVVTEDTAQSFVLEDYKIGKDSQLFGELDLTFFSMKYQESDILSDIFRMPSDTAQVSQLVSLFVRRKKDGRGPRNFTGILWAEFDL
jgi:hypothetical protein